MRAAAKRPGKYGPVQRAKGQRYKVDERRESEVSEEKDRLGMIEDQGTRAL